MDEDQIFETIPDGFDWGITFFAANYHSVAMFAWDQDKSSKKLIIDDDQLTVKVKDGSGFKTSFGDQVSLVELSKFIQPFNEGGRYYFQVQLNQGNLVKIGVSRKDILSDSAFSDTSTGWAIYNGELRHNSNSSGPKYGSSIQAGDVIGGTLSFSKNGRNWGVAFKDEELKKGTLFPAVAPIYSGDSYSIRRPTPED
ncbi:spry domain containing protein [Stylonychia lemnae]|uniref:Spry domain containing protein n=1 Tax=Stylonychia lemnae TaxID=5949 RepID=A0A078A340_STYLE|nr:spry domain containing protein [Stylonychia lemnae]|eukprot:CDW75184.1 spry domain containing protein [Stylonychia lemnae]